MHVRMNAIKIDASRNLIRIGSRSKKRQLATHAKADNPGSFAAAPGIRKKSVDRAPQYFLRFGNV